MNFWPDLDTKLFLFLNGLHVAKLDPVMIFISGKFTWIPFYLILLYLVIRKYKWQSLWAILVIVMLVICSDQLSAHVFKPLFRRLRPCHNESIRDLVYLPTGHCGGKYGFISSHACNVFALAVFLTRIMKRKYKRVSRIVFILVMFFWATIVAYSRIYLGVHYPGDILCGALVGALIGFLAGKLFFLLNKTATGKASSKN